MNATLSPIDEGVLEKIETLISQMTLEEKLGKLHRDNV